MKNNKKLIGVLEGIGILILGVLIAVLGVGATVNIYFAVVACIFGAVCLGFALFLILKGEVLSFAPLALGGALIAIGIGVFTNQLSFGIIIGILIFALMGVSAAFILFGLYTMVKFNLFYGLGEMVVGGALLALTLVYYFNKDFQNIFWIIAGILIAVFGGVQIIYTITRKK